MNGQQAAADKKTLHISAKARYLLFMLLVVLFSLQFNADVFVPDPLVICSGCVGRLQAVLCSVLIPAFFYKRFWCWNFCPAGALLALLSRIRIIRRLAPAVFPGLCDIGVQKAADHKCLCCDRCRAGNRKKMAHNKSEAAAAGQRRRNVVFLGITSLVFILLLFFTLEGFLGPAESKAPESRQATAAAADMQKLESMINAGKLSDHEALYYKSAWEK